MTAAACHTYRGETRARLDPARVDVVLAAVLFLVLVLQAAFLPMPAGDRLVTPLSGGLVTASVAVRRRFPVAVGLGVQTVLVLTGPFVSLPVGPVAIAWFCALYALTVWTSRRWFMVGVAFFAASNLAPQLIAPDLDE
jgi:hypothetical protein